MLDEMTVNEIEAGMALTDKLEAFFYSEDLEEYPETDFFQQVACRKTEKIEKTFSALPEKMRAIAFHHAVLTDDPDIVEACANAAKKAKANIDAEFCDPEYGVSPLMQACFNSCENAFSVLVEKGEASLSVKDNRGRGLAYACLFSHDLEFMKWAKKHGVEFDLNNPVDAVLPLAGAECSAAVLRWLIEDLHGDANVVDEEGHTALYYAFMFGVRENILYLIGKGAYPIGDSEKALVPIVEHIKELRAQRPSDVIDLEIAREIERLKEFANKL